MAALSKRFARLVLVILFVVGMVILMEWGLSRQMQMPRTSVPLALATEGSLTNTLYLPLVLHDFVPPSGRLCRYGVGAGTSIAEYDVNSLRLGWYVDWSATEQPSRPGGIEYMPMIRLHQTGPNSYAYTPFGNALSNTISANPGATWIIGNEPDRRNWQDDMEPGVYAQAYHDLYYLIKKTDPAAQIAAGSIVQPTPLRLQYLDMVLASYQNLYSESMPVDVWNVHNFILHERSCDYYPDDCWGAGIPPGINAAEGKLYTVQDNDNMDYFKQHIEAFRDWMSKNGYQDRPVIITEFGVQMPADYGFSPERVNAFMDASFDYLRTMTNTQGYPADDYHLVQRWAWYSLLDNNFNGWLFDPTSKNRTVFGDHFAAYTSQRSPTVNLTPVKVYPATTTILSSGTLVTITLYADVTNNGNIETLDPIIVRFYDGDPEQSGTQIGADQTIYGLQGCATMATVRVTWSSTSPGDHTVYVVVDPLDNVTESNESDNVRSASISVAVFRPSLPTVLTIAP